MDFINVLSEVVCKYNVNNENTYVTCIIEMEPPVIAGM